MIFVPPKTFNISEYFLGDRIAEGLADRRAILTDSGMLTYGDVPTMVEGLKVCKEVLEARGLRNGS